MRSQDADAFVDSEAFRGSGREPEPRVAQMSAIFST